MKRKYIKPVLKVEVFCASEEIAAPVPTPPGDLNSMGLDDIVASSVTSYSVGSAPGLTATPSPSPSPLPS